MHFQVTDVDGIDRLVLDESRVTAGVVAVVSLTVGLTASKRDEDVLADSSSLSLLILFELVSMVGRIISVFFVVAARSIVQANASDHQL